MPGPPFILGDRVDLHTVEAEDLPFLQANVNHPDVRRYLHAGRPLNRIQEREWFEADVSDGDGDHLLVVVDGERAGIVGLEPDPKHPFSAEIGLHLAPDHWGEGYGTEASRLLTDYAFRERRYHRVVARVYDPNEASKRIWEKLGFRHEAVHREAVYLDGAFEDVHYYAVLEGEWQAARND